MLGRCSLRAIHGRGVLVSQLFGRLVIPLRGLLLPLFRAKTVFDHRVCPQLCTFRVFPMAAFFMTCLRNVRESALLNRVWVALTVPPRRALQPSLIAIRSFLTWEILDSSSTGKGSEPVTTNHWPITGVTPSLSSKSFYKQIYAHPEPRLLTGLLCWLKCILTPKCLGIFDRGDPASRLQIVRIPELGLQPTLLADCRIDILGFQSPLSRVYWLEYNLEHTGRESFQVYDSRIGALLPNCANLRWGPRVPKAFYGSRSPVTHDWSPPYIP
ncbi:hypothetical protein BJ322DRAFT_809308 [Thelephora terrestris]|uniref:Uncharacterized protein n=1 Tax=Thelephora terrestris TaxID=56493 RepID=A0A9P6HEF5_9AGAM|nr:hypothetical protein BJ322DRAFT_809308 [Thelephora terrestris]